MKFKIRYYELREKEFRSERTLNRFLKSKLDCEILAACQYKEGRSICALSLSEFIDRYKYLYNEHIQEKDDGILE